MTTIAMPQLGDAPTETTLARWLVKVGDVVRENDLLFEIETEKISTDVPAPSAGVVKELLVREGEAVMTGAAVCVLEAAAQPEPVSSTAGNGKRSKLSPVVRKLARLHEIDLSAVPASGPHGRITRNDVLAFLEHRPRTEVPPGRGRLSPLRARIAELTTASKRTAPHVFSMLEVDMENVAAVREKHRGELTYLPFIARAAVEALAAIPEMNSSIDVERGIAELHGAIHLAIAVDTDRGLYAPVIRHAEELTVRGLGRRIVDLAERTRAGKIKAEELTGSTFTITNPGAFGSQLTAPVINQPNVAILSTEVVERRVVPIGNAIEIRRRMNLCMSWDHRAFDGGLAMRFLARVKKNLEQWDWQTLL